MNAAFEMDVLEVAPLIPELNFNEEFSYSSSISRQFT
jgi:hypothetical protein